MTPEAKTDVIAWLQTPQRWNIASLKTYLHRQDEVVYLSKQSDYELLHEAKLSWKKTQNRNPHADPAKVKTTRDTIKKNGARGGCTHQEGDGGGMCG